MDGNDKQKILAIFEHIYREVSGYTYQRERLHLLGSTTKSRDHLLSEIVSTANKALDIIYSSPSQVTKPNEPNNNSENTYLHHKERNFDL